MKQHFLPSDLERIVLTLCKGISTVMSEKVSRLVKTGCWDDLVSLRVDPLAYDDADSYFRDVAITSFLRKCEDLHTTIDRRKVAVDAFWACEKLCKRTNERLNSHLWDSPADRLLAEKHPDDPGSACILLVAEARKEMFKLLGPCPDLSKGKFGPGATYADKGALTTVPDKMSSRPTMTPGFWPHLFSWVGTQWAKACCESGRVPITVRGNRFTTVPKDCSKDRGIAVEPSLNSFYQLAYGKAIRRRLRSRGIDLRNGQNIHRQVARESSITGHFATLDLSNASDTVSRSLVKLLLPTDWYEVLSELRSPTTEIEGKTVCLEKFSSMGNGFTFELETAIFLAISLAVRNLRNARNPDSIYPMPGDGIWVYGDDIIVPTCFADDVIGALTYLGFSINKEKSFTEGYFRESCGGDYFNGVDVRPHFLKEFPNEPQQFIALANGIRRMGVFDTHPTVDRSYLRRSWFCILDFLPVHIRGIRGPQGLGDLVINDDEQHWKQRWRGDLRYIRVYKPVPARVIGWEHFKPEVVLATALYGEGDGATGVTPRDNVSGYKLGWVPFPSATSRWLPSGCLRPKGALERLRGD